MSEHEILQDLEQALSPKRFLHTLGTAKAALILAKHYGADVSQAHLAALVHDCAKELPYEQQLSLAQRSIQAPDEQDLLFPPTLHAPASEVLARERYGVCDTAILCAVRYHTIPRENMTRLDKIIFLADYIEENRTFPGVDALRTAAFEDLRIALRQALLGTMQHLLSTGTLVHPDTLRFYNALTLELSDL